MRLLNLGCGVHFHADWVNADIAPDSPEVLAVDLAGELPFPRGSFDAVYCSHVLEHFAPADADSLLRRIHGLLKPGGILRVVVPDLEALARAYIGLLERFERDPQSREARAADYDWILLELYDQVARSEGGGGMVRFLADRLDRAPRNPEFIRSRIGAEAYAALEAAARGVWHQPARPGLRQRFAAARQWLAGAAAGMIGGAAARRAHAEGVFRQSGEIHRWMYDSYSLARALRGAGFGNTIRQSASESRIPAFARYQLDVDAQGAVRKPDSLFMEAERA